MPKTLNPGEMDDGQIESAVRRSARGKRRPATIEKAIKRLFFPDPLVWVQKFGDAIGVLIQPGPGRQNLSVHL